VQKVVENVEDSIDVSQVVVEHVDRFVVVSQEVVEYIEVIVVDSHIDVQYVDVTVVAYKNVAVYVFVVFNPIPSYVIVSIPNVVAALVFVKHRVA
jgi:hypothetical protein